MAAIPYAAKTNIMLSILKYKAQGKDEREK